MVPKKLLSSLNYKQVFGLLRLFVRQPLMIIPTIRATGNCIKIAEELFPGIHHINNPANAFRHALWNMLLVIEAYKWNKNIDKALAWAKLITDWHEEFSPNLPLEKAMDLHNNAFGRNLISKLYQEKDTLKTESIKDQLILTINNSKKISNIQELDLLKNQMVYLID